MKSVKENKYAAPALEKGLDILELLSKEPEGLSISEIAERLSRSVSQLFRMMVVLERRGYVSSRPNSDLYMLTLKMFELSHMFPPVKHLSTVAGSILKRLAAELRQSCHLVTYYEGKGHVVVQQDSPSERVFSVRLGARAPLINTCSGHVLLAFADDLSRVDMVKEIPKSHPKAKKADVDEIVTRVKNQGYEQIRSAQIQGVQDIGFPVFDHNGLVAAALVVPYLAYLDNSNPISIEQARIKAEQAALDLSKLLGFHTP